MFPCTPFVYFLGALCSFFIYILLFTDKKKILVGKRKHVELGNFIFFLIWFGIVLYINRLFVINERYNFSFN